jgi:hypothetical protein
MDEKTAVKPAKILSHVAPVIQMQPHLLQGSPSRLEDTNFMLISHSSLGQKVVKIGVDVELCCR